MPDLNLKMVLQGLGAQMESSLAQQVISEGRPDTGGFIRADWGIDCPSSTTSLVARALCLHFARYLHPETAPAAPTSALLLERANLALDYLFRVQRPSGLTDLRDCNYDSAPDAGFILQTLCPVIELGRPLVECTPEWSALLARLEAFAFPMAQGMLTGGFHTPNHRWVMAASMAMAQLLFPDLNAGPTLDAYLAEGFDLDAEGFYIEHSAGVYDAICDRSLLLLADYADVPAARETANANLATDLFLFDADGKIESGLSRRQDFGSRPLPLSLTTAYLHSALATPNPLFLRAARFLWNAAPPEQQDCFGLALLLVRYGEPPPSEVILPDRFEKHFPTNGLWRVRRGPLSASIFANTTRLLTVRNGTAELASIKISQSYFGAGQFVGETLTTEGETARLHSSGIRLPRRPGYEMPLGKPVPPEQYRARVGERDLRRLPYAESELSIKALEDGFDLNYRTLDGMAGVTTQVAFDFVPGGVWETDDCAYTPQAGAVIFLKNGYGTMRYGNDTLQIGPGADAHRMNPMRDAETAPNHVRVLVTFFTPVDHLFRLRVHYGVTINRRDTE